MNARVLTCSCNDTVDLDPGALKRALTGAGIKGEVVMSGSQLCRRQLVDTSKWLEGVDDIVLTCTQERALFSEAGHRAVAPIKFVNIREQAGWGQEGKTAQPKIAALVAMAVRDVREPVAAVSYKSQGRVLLIGNADALLWARRLAALSSAPLSVSVLLPSETGQAKMPPLGGVRDFPVFSGEVASVTGWLGSFEVDWRQVNPIDLDACVRCGACVSACPEGAIDQSLQVDMARCTAHRSCVAACGEIAAIDFSRRDAGRREQFDMVIDFREQAAFVQHQLPQGYWHPGGDVTRQIEAALAAAELVGEFEKPKFFEYRQNICAHKRNEIVGCTQCIDVCSALAIRSRGDGVQVEPHLCVGCGACATACPSGAMTYAYPDPPSVGTRVRAALSAYRNAGGKRPVILIHGGDNGEGILAALGRGAGASVASAPAMQGLPARVIPLSVHHAASIGMDLGLAFLAFGAAQVVWWFNGSEAPQYRELVEREIGWAGALLVGIGLTGERLRTLDATSAIELESRLAQLQTPAELPLAATFAVSDDKRRTIEFAVDHLIEAVDAGAQSNRLLAAVANLVTGGAREGAAVPRAAIALPQSAPFGRLQIDQQACTLCLACIGSCPEKALLDMGDEPGLRFIERNCVQCGLCAKTCPEDAISLEPRYLPGKEREQTVTLNNAIPLACIHCGKLFGTQQMIGAMKRKLAGHRMFGDAQMRALEMCADCRVTEMFSASGEVSVLDIKRDGV
jgi:ferredoxin